jgi:hypothetical protein
MKILIAGDSFCKESDHKYSKFAWTRQLETILYGSNVNCVGQGASSVFSALQQVKKQLLIDNSYDTVIVLITIHERLYQTTEPIISGLNNALKHKELYQKSNLNEARIFNKIEACRMYYEFLHEPALSIFILESCLKELQSLCGNRQLILFPCFDTCEDSAFASEILGLHGFTLYQCVLRETANFVQLTKNHGDWKERHVEGDSRIGMVDHMCADNQLMLAHYFSDLIQFNKSKINLDWFFKLPATDFDLYYKPLDQIQYKGTDF